MFGGLERDERLVEAIGLPIGVAIVPRAGVAGDAETKFVVAPVLVGLVGVTGVDARRAHQREPDGVVIGFVGAVLTVGKDGGAESVGAVGEIDPLVGGHFELALAGSRAADGAETPVVSGVVVSRAQGESSLE